MKVFNFIYVCIFVFLLSFAANASCPPGWTTVTPTIGPDISGCYYDIELCYKCGITGANPTNIKLISLKPNVLLSPSGCFGPSKDWLVQQIKNQYWSFCLPKPCSEGCTTYILEFPLCYEIHTMGNLYYGNYIYYSWYSPCPESGYCQITSKLCREYPSNLIMPCPGWEDVPLTFNLNCPMIPPPPFPTVFEKDFVGEIITGPCFQMYKCE